MQLKASAPGSLMLLGEHAVLHGKNALVAAIDKRLSVTLTPRQDTKIILNSALGDYQTDLADIKIEAPFQFVLAAIQSFRDALPSGFELKIENEFSDQTGLGSSAAVTVATLSVLSTWLNLNLSQLDLTRRGRDIVRQVQGVGSGADIAAAVHGGIVNYLADPVHVEAFAVELPIHAIYAGYKTKTAAVIQHVNEYFADDPDSLQMICDCIHQCVLDSVKSLQQKDYQSLGEIMNAQQEWMEALNVSSDGLRAIIHDLRNQKNIFGAKISGSGMGDCVIALGDLPDDYQCVIENKILQRIPVRISLQGVRCEKI